MSIKRFENLVVTEDEFNEIECDPEVIKVINNGCSGLYHGYTYYTAYLADRTEFDFYFDSSCLLYHM